MVMRKHWSVHAHVFSENSPRGAVWKLEQRINFGIGEMKIPEDTLRSHWNDIDIDPWKRKALALALQK